MCERVASRELELPYYRGVSRQRGRGFGALAQVIGRIAVPFVKKFIVPAARSPAFLGSFTENPFWYQQFGLRHIRTLRGGQSVTDYDTSDDCRLYVTTMRAMNFHDDLPSIPIDKFKDQYVLVFDLSSMQDATEHCHYPELIGKLLRLELNFNEALESVTEVIILGERMSSVAVDKFGVVGKIPNMDDIALRQIIDRIPLLKYRYHGSFHSDRVPNLSNDTFAIVKT